MAWIDGNGQFAHIWVKHLLCGGGGHIDVHKIIAIDDPRLFHTHPAYAIRLILWGGYYEELEGGARKIWRPGMVGVVQPTARTGLPNSAMAACRTRCGYAFENAGG